MSDDLVPDDAPPATPRWLSVRTHQGEPSGAEVADGAPFAEWLAYTASLLRFARGLQWLIGDLLVRGEQLYGEAYAQALDAADYESETVRACGWVASRFPPGRRRTLSWSHHREVAALDAASADALLERAEAEGLSTRELRRLAGAGRRAAPHGQPAAEEKPADDFQAWLESFATPGAEHVLVGGHHVRLSPLANVHVLSAEQALRLSERLRRLAETGKDES